MNVELVNLNDECKSHNHGIICMNFGVLDPPALAAQVFGDSLHAGQLFLYLFRRFGPHIDSIDSYKQCASYTFSTPRIGLWLNASVAPTVHGASLFGCCVARDLFADISEEEGRRVQDWHDKKRDWCRAKGVSHENAFDKYISAHPEKESELHDGCWPLKAECNAALLESMRALMRPTYCRDVYFTPKGLVEDTAHNAVEYREVTP